MTGVEIDIRYKSERGWRVEFPPHWGLRESREGIFRASYLASTGKSTNEGALGSLSNAIDLTSEDKVQSLGSTTPDLPHVVYKHFIASVLSTVSYGISKSSFEGEDKRWIPLNITTLIQIQSKYTPISTSPIVSSFSLPTPPSSARMHNNGRTESYGRGGIMMFSVSGYLTSSGTLCIIPTGRRVDGLGSFASLSNTGDASHLVSHVVSRDVWIAPWGRVGRIQGLVSSAPNAPTAMRVDEREWASEVRHYLLERGVGLRADEEEWARIEVWLDNEDGEDQFQTIVWPTALCFVRLTERAYGLLPNPSQGTSIQFESSDPQQREQETLGEPGNTKDDRAAGATAISQDLFADFEYLALSGHILTHQGERLAPDDPGATWFSPNVLDPIDFAEKWRMSAEQRKQTIKQRREEREKEKRKAVEAEALKHKAEELLGKEKELRREVDEIKRDAAATIGSVSGVYSTPPDGQIPAAIALPGGSQEVPPPEPVSVVSADGMLPLTLSSDMDLDWTGTGDPMSLDESGNVAKASATDGLARITDFLGDDLVDGDDDIFGAEVTDKDFDFFDEPDFGDALDGGIGLGDMHRVGGGVGTDTLRDVEESSLAVADMIDMSNHSNPMNSLQNLDFEEMDRIDATTGLEINITTPMLSKLELPASNPTGPREGAAPGVDSCGEIIKHIQTPPLSPQRAMKLLLPQYAKHQTTWHPPNLSSSLFNPPKAQLAVEDLTNSRRQSIYSPLVFLPGVEMADKKYMEGGRFFGPPPKEEKVECLDGKLASISLLDSPLKRRLSSRKSLRSLTSNTPRDDSIHHSQAAEPAIEELEIHPTGDEDGDSYESEYEYDDNDESSESDVDEESETEYSLPPLPESSPVYTTGNKRKRAVDDDGELALAETGRESASIATPLPPGQFDIDGKIGGMELAPPPWHAMVPDPDDYCLVDVFEKLCADDTTRDEYSTVSRMTEAEHRFICHELVSNIITGSLLQPRCSGVDSSVFEEDSGLDSLMTRRRVSGESQVEEVVKNVFPGATRCKFETYATIPDAPAQSTPLLGKANFRPIAQPRRTGKHCALPPGNHSLTAFDSSTAASSTVSFKIPPSHVHVHRGEAALEISPVALKFWETFGLAPCSGPKNVIAFCVYPSGEAMADAVDEFMERVGTVYDSCKLGNYIRGNIDDITAGMSGVQLPPRHAEELDMGAIMQCIKDACMRLGSMLYNVADEMQNIVVYLVNPFIRASVLPELCHAFYFLKQAYMATMTQLNAAPNNIILQIVPIDLLTAKNGLITPSQEDYIRFSLEVYNRCMVTENDTSSEEVRNDKVSLFSSSSSKMPTAKNAPQASSMLNSWRQKMRERVFSYAPSIVLAKPVPKSINFQLSAETVNPLLQEGSCLHVAYKQSLDERWVVFAWTDNYGDFQYNEVICLGRKGCIALKPWEEVARFAWSKTMEWIRRKSMMPRVCITKVGGWIDADEVECEYSQLELSFSDSPNVYPSMDCVVDRPGPSNQSSKTTTSLTILTADPSPALSLAPSLPAIIPQAFNSGSNLFTPVSTPNASMLSPDPSGSTSAINTNTAGGTPNADAALDLDPDTQLTDYADEVWGVVLNHRLPISPVVTEARYSLASGFLVKRGAMGVEGDGEPAMLGVNVVGVVSGSGPPPGKNVVEGQLKEILCQWRGLATLAIHKGVVRERENRGVLPWHVAVAEKGVDALEICM
ncbi:mediator complex subunit 13 C-terminal-domain-containing protein [Terfezia claveryi]|nr:mediator complex subunit 13 C-terminal-domain-containing protein [Terfezia claveryi]